MKSGRIFLGWLLAAALLPGASLALYVVDSGTCGDGLTWSLDSSGSLTVSGAGPMADYAFEKDVPWRADSDRITHVVVENGVTAIGTRAFSDCAGLKSAVIPDSVTVIGDNAFWACSGLTDIAIPDGVTAIGKNAFWACSGLTGVTIPDGVTCIRDRAFSGCSGLTDVVLPGGLTDIGEGAFQNCTGLTGVTIPDGVTYIGKDAFSGCVGLTDIAIPDGVTSIRSGAFEGCGELTDVTIPDGVTVIEADAFHGCSGLTDIAIPDGVTSIGDHAFWGCTDLTGIALPAGMTFLGEDVFFGCESLESICFGGTVEQWHRLTKTHQQAGLAWIEIRFAGEEPLFADVDNSAYYAVPALWAALRGISNGTDADCFSPDDPCTRGQAVTFLWRAAGMPEPTGAENPFADISGEDYCYKAVLWAAETGVTNGTSPTAFSPDNPCTRGQVVTFLYRLAGMPVPIGPNPFRDVGTDAYYLRAVLWAVSKGVTNGTTPGSFSPGEPCTRGQIVTFLYRAAAV